MALDMQEIVNTMSAERMAQGSAANTNFLNLMDRAFLKDLIEPGIDEAAAARQLMSRETPINNTQPGA